MCQGNTGFKLDHETILKNFRGFVITDAVSRDSLISVPNGLLGAQQRIYVQMSLNSCGHGFYELKNPFLLSLVIEIMKNNLI